MFGWLRRLGGRRSARRSSGSALVRVGRPSLLRRVWDSVRGIVRAPVPSEMAMDASGFIPASQFTSSSALDTLFHASCYAYSCIMANATEASSLGAMVQKRVGGQWIRAEHRELQALLDAPCGMPAMGVRPSPPQWTWQDLIFLWYAHTCIAGNAYAVPTMTGGGRRIWSLLPLLPDKVLITEDTSTLYPSRYSTGSTVYRPDELVHFMHPTPLSFSSGHSLLQVALRAISIDYTAESRMAWNLENKVSPGVILSVHGFMGATQEQKDAMLAYLSKEYAGASKDGSPLVLGEGTEMVGAPSQTKELAYEAIIGSATKKILAVAGTPPPVIGLYDNATLNNFSTAFKIWWMVTLFPKLRGLYSTLNTQLIHPTYGYDWRLWYDDRSSDIALVLERERIAAAAELVAIGYPPNLATRHVGIDIETVPELDVPLQNLAVAGRALSETQTP